MDIDGFLSYVDKVKDSRIERAKKHILQGIMMMCSFGSLQKLCVTFSHESAWYP
jgi:5,10-methylenetetrahydrofolate reductase